MDQKSYKIQHDLECCANCYFNDMVQGELVCGDTGGWVDIIAVCDQFKSKKKGKELYGTHSKAK